MSNNDPLGNVSVSLRNLLNSVEFARDRVRDQAAKTVSQEATKLSLAFSKPPLPSQEDVEKLANSMVKSVLSLSTVYCWLPKSQGLTLRGQVRDATVEVLEGVAQLLEVILSSPLQSLTQEHLTSTGCVWHACDHFAELPTDNKAAVVIVLSSQIGIVKDAVEEIQETLSGARHSLDDISSDHEDEEEPQNNHDADWSEKDRRVIDPCQGLMKASAACLRKLTSAIKTNGDVTTPQNLAQLDDLAGISKSISPSIDDLVLCLYPPMDYNGVENNVSKIATLLKTLLDKIRSTHVCKEAELSWVQFLDGAVSHNLQKAIDLIQSDS